MAIPTRRELAKKVAELEAKVEKLEKAAAKQPKKTK